MLDTDAVLKALKLYATCPKSRLPEVVEMLRKLGMDVPVSDVTMNEKLDHRDVLVRKRADQPTPKWVHSDDETVNLIRQAYFKGISLVALARTLGMHKTTLYQYMYGYHTIPAYTAGQITRAICDWEASIGE